MKQNSSPPNVHGWERAASIAGGLYFLGKGLARGGLGGIVQLGLGGMVLARGISGHCEAKRVLCELNEHTATDHSRRMLVPDETDQQQMKASAQAATGTATVTGNDSLASPPAGV